LNVSILQEIAALRKDNKAQQQQISSTDVRLSRALEEAERLRGSVKSTQQKIKVLKLVTIDGNDIVSTNDCRSQLAILPFMIPRSKHCWHFQRYKRLNGTIAF